MGVEPILLPFPTFDPALLSCAKSIVIQRPCVGTDIDLLKRYKELQPKFGYKLVGEFDDLIFYTGDAPEEIDGVPPYNPGHENMKKNKDAIKSVLSQTLPLLDLIVVSTDYLKKSIEKVFGVNNVMVVKNVVPRFLWNFERKMPIKQDLVKPRIIYSAADSKACSWTAS